jgi:hypothetical protein
MTTQDVSKKGLKFGDEEEDEFEKKELAAQNVAFKPLINFLKKELAGQISDGADVQSESKRWVLTQQLSSLTVWSLRLAPSSSVSALCVRVQGRR